MDDDIYYLDPFVVTPDDTGDTGGDDVPWWGGEDVPDDAWFDNWWDGYDDQTYRDLAASNAAYDYFTQLERDINAKIAAANGGRAPALSRPSSAGSSAGRAGSSGGASGGSSSGSSANQALQQVAGLIGNLAKALGLVKTPAATSATATRAPAGTGAQLTPTGTIVAVAAVAAMGYLAVKALRK